jgi:hypothetical protein
VIALAEIDSLGRRNTIVRAAQAQKAITAPMLTTTSIRPPVVAALVYPRTSAKAENGARMAKNHAAPMLGRSTTGLSPDPELAACLEMLILPVMMFPWNERASASARGSRR